MNIDELRDLLERYRQGSCTAWEKEAVESWYASLHPGEEVPLSADALEESLARVRERLPWVDEGVSRPRRLRSMRQTMWMAAAVLMVLVVGIWLLLVPHGGRGPVAVLADSDVLVVTGRGETRQIVLPDGSSLQVNAGTELRYPKQFAGAQRLVTLTRGEAYFQVVADAARPFVVTSGGVRTRVLGTSFDIRAYREEGRVRVAVLSGKVEVVMAGKSVRVLEKGMLALGDTSGLVSERFDGEEEVAAWKEGGLYFKDASFEQIAFEVANKYNIPLINRSSKRVWSYTGFFRSGSLQEVVETICQTENLQYRFSNGELVIF